MKTASPRLLGRRGVHCGERQTAGDLAGIQPARVYGLPGEQERGRQAAARQPAVGRARAQPPAAKAAKAAAGRDGEQRIAHHATPADDRSSAGVACFTVGEQAGERIGVQLRRPARRAASEGAKIATISRAEGGQLQAPVS